MLTSEFITSAGAFLLACAGLMKAYINDREANRIKASRASTKLERDSAEAELYTKLALVKQRQEQMELEQAEQKGKLSAQGETLSEIKQTLQGIKELLDLIVQGKVSIGEKK
jgi:hypothetical protein